MPVARSSIPGPLQPFAGGARRVALDGSPATVGRGARGARRASTPACATASSTEQRRGPAARQRLRGRRQHPRRAGPRRRACPRAARSPSCRPSAAGSRGRDAAPRRRRRRGGRRPSSRTSTPSCSTTPPTSARRRPRRWPSWPTTPTGAELVERCIALAHRGARSTSRRSQARSPQRGLRSRPGHAQRLHAAPRAGVPRGQRRLLPGPPADRRHRRGARLRALRPRRGGAARRGRSRTSTGSSPAPRCGTRRLYLRSGAPLLRRGARSRRGSRSFSDVEARIVGELPVARRALLSACLIDSAPVTATRPVTQYLARHAEPEAAAADALTGALRPRPRRPRLRRGTEPLRHARLGAEGPAGRDAHHRRPERARGLAARGARGQRRGRAARLRGVAKAAADLAERAPALRRSTFPNGTVLVVDRARPGHFLPEGQGVGLARKIGNDFALRAPRRGPDRLALDPQHRRRHACSPTTTSTRPRRSRRGGNAAALYFFEHRFERRPRRSPSPRGSTRSRCATTRSGLAWAGSPYAYQAMGSCIAVRPEAYAAVRGFPRKNAAEDFYVLDKLAKVGSIVAPGRLAAPARGTRLATACRSERARRSPTSSTKKRALSGFRLYHPAVFAHLAAWLRVLDGRRAIAADASTPRSRSCPARTRSS